MASRRTVTMSAECLDLIRTMAVFPLDESALIENADGTFTFEMSDDIFARVEAFRAPEEMFSDALMRVLKASAEVMPQGTPDPLRKAERMTRLHDALNPRHSRRLH